MTGYVTKNSPWINEPMTGVQRAIVTALGFDMNGTKWNPDAWSCGAFSDDEMPIVIRHLPYLPEVNAALKSVGFRWDAERKEWYGEDRTKEQVEVLQALSFCSRRYYKNQSQPKWAVESGAGGYVCPVRVGAYG